MLIFLIGIYLPIFFFCPPNSRLLGLLLDEVTGEEVTVFSARFNAASPAAASGFLDITFSFFLPILLGDKVNTSVLLVSVTVVVVLPVCSSIKNNADAEKNISACSAR